MRARRRRCGVESCDNSSDRGVSANDAVDRPYDRSRYIGEGCHKRLRRESHQYDLRWIDRYRGVHPFIQQNANQLILPPQLFPEPSTYFRLAVVPAMSHTAMACRL